MLSEEDGKELLTLARRVIERWFNFSQLKIEKSKRKALREKRGVFVTILKSGKLRGCIGFVKPIYPLDEGVQRAAHAACFQDLRFKPLSKEELASIRFKISILTPLELIKVKHPMEYLEKIKIGKDGLYLEKGLNSAVFLPEVPIEEGWEVEEYLENLCFKAGLSPVAWMEKDSKLYKFRTQTFEET